MPDPLGERHGRFNPPAVIVARLIFILQLFGWAIGVFFMVLAFGEANAVRLVQAAVVFLLSFAGREWLRRTNRLRECAESFDTMFIESDGLARVGGPAAERLAELVERREWLE